MKKILYISLDILYIDEKMSQNVSKKVRLGPKEKEVLDFLKNYPDGIWKDEVLAHFSWASRYLAVINKRLQRLEKKGLITIVYEINPETGRSKKRVYLKQ